jgi:hypothetical protein
VALTDPWLVLGIAPGSSLADARVARRRLAKQLHPDVHTSRPPAELAELAARMTLVNGALAEIEMHWQSSPGLSGSSGSPDSGALLGSSGYSGSPGPPGSSGSPGSSGYSGWPGPPGSSGSAGWPGSPGSSGSSGSADLAYACGPADPDSFSVEILPVEAFEALFVAAYGLGDILVADEPYLLELYLTEPSACFCRLTLVPEAGASLVTVDVSPATESIDAPEPAAVIAVLVAELNTLITR